MNPCDPTVTMRDLAAAQLAELAGKAASNIQAAAQEMHPDAVHDMRVSIRRLQQAIRTYKQYVPEKAAKQIRKQLKRIMDPAGELRNHDIAIQLVNELGSDMPELRQRRSLAEVTLREAIRELAAADLHERWTKKLWPDAA